MKVAMFTTNPNFWGSILEEMRAHHTVKVWKWTRNNERDIPNMLMLIDWADLAYFDFIQWPLTFISRFQVKMKPIVARMDGLDVLEHVNVNWTNVDALVLMPVQERRLDKLRRMWHENNPGRRLPRLPKRILKRNVGIDLDLFHPDWDREPGYDIVLHSSVIRPTKRVYTALQLFHELLEKDGIKPWRLTLIGQWEGGWNWQNRKEYVMATSELLDQLRFSEDRLRLITQNFARARWAEFARGMDVVWCTSYREGFPNSVGECCASGAYPVMNWFYAAEAIYPERYLCRTPSEFVQKTIEWGGRPNEDKEHEKRGARTWIERYSRHQTAIDIRRLCEEVYEEHVGRRDS